MSLLNPWGLLGLLSLPAIIGLHMHLERNRQAEVSSLRLWSFLDVQLRGARPKRIRISWLLALDLAIAFLLTAALARPELHLPAFFGYDRQVVILWDDSTSMLATDGGASRFDLARDEIVELIQEVGRREIVTVVMAGREPVILGDSRELTKGRLMEQVERQQAGGTGTDLETALALAASGIGERLPVEIHVFTDGAYELPLSFESRDDIRWHVIGSYGNNQGITTIAAALLGKTTLQVFVEVGNFGGLPANRTMVVEASGREVRREALELPPFTLVQKVWNVTGERDWIQVRLEGEDDLAVDDQASMGINPGGEVRVALVSDIPEPVDKAIRSIPEAVLDIYGVGEPISTLDYDWIVYRGTLPESWPVGKVLVLDPPAGSELFPVIGTGKIENQPESDFPLIDAGYFAGVRWGEGYVLAGDDYEVLVHAGEVPVLVRGDFGLTEVYGFLPVLAQGNLTKHPAFPLVIANLISAGQDLEFPDQIDFGDKLPYLSVEKNTNVSVLDAEGMQLEGEIDAGFETETAGIYQVEVTDLQGEKSRYWAGVNAGSLEESAIQPEGWTQSVGGASETDLENVSRRVDLTPWLLLIAGLLLVPEAWRAWR